MEGLYPKEILPEDNYIIIDRDDYTEDLYFSRRAIANDQLADDLGDVRIDAIITSSQDLYGLSLNLLGRFNAEHNFYIVDNKSGLLDLWAPGMDIPDPENIEYEYEKCALLFLELSKINGCDYPYHYSNSEYNGRGKVIHSPIKCNYWHYELKFIDNDGKEITRDSKKWKRSAAKSFIKSYLKKHIKLVKPDYKLLDESFYIKIV